MRPRRDLRRGLSKRICSVIGVSPMPSPQAAVRADSDAVARRIRYLNGADSSAPARPVSSVEDLDLVAALGVNGAPGAIQVRDSAARDGESTA